MKKIDVAGELNSARKPAGNKAGGCPVIVGFPFPPAWAYFESKTAAGRDRMFIDENEHSLIRSQGDANHFFGAAGRRSAGGTKAVRHDRGLSVHRTRTGNVKHE